jgi:type IV pilus assembly protein PilM
MGISLGLRNKNKVSLVIKDHVIQYLDTKQQGIDNVLDFGERFIPQGVIEEGKIVDGGKLQIILQECIQKWGLKRREVQFVIPDTAVVVRKIEIPGDIPDNEIRGYLYLELGQSIHLPYENPLFHVEVLKKTDKKKAILVFAAPENIVNDYASILEKAGLVPTVADISPLSVYRLFYKVEDLKNESILSVQFNIQNVTISIFKVHKLIFVRQLNMNIQMDKWKLELEKSEELLKWTGDEGNLFQEVQEVIDEIERILNFYRYNLSQENDQIEKILLTGDNPYLQEINARIQQAVEIPTISLLDKKFSSIKDTPIPSRYHLILGLSLKGAQL